MENPYRTMDFAYMESEWWAFKKLYDDGLIYEDYRSMHICPRCETTLSQGEVAEGYRDVKDISVTVKFKIKNPKEHDLPENTYLLAWTTTPWTLPGNVALAVGRGISYDLLLGEENLILSSQQRAKLGLFYEGPEITPAGKNLKGKDLIGLEYEPLFDYYSKDASLKNHANGWKVYAGDFVTTETGTGIVHIAPAFGEDDMSLSKKEHLPFVQHVGIDGVFRPEMNDFAGMQVKPIDDPQATDVQIIKYLAHNGLLFSKEKIEHSYPHCWRCDTPLLNYATSSWFVAVEKIKDKLMKTAENIEWSPAHIKAGRFGEWLKGARDWSISRQRFWANTIPVWRCEACKADRVFGSALELEKVSGKKVTDLHKDFVDDVTFACECGGLMKRVPDVLDTWFDSGSVPFAILHYPKENKATFKNRVPADFIAEAQDQCRAWFYYQHVLMGALFGKEAFKHCIVTGIVLAEDGKKMSKKLNNYPDPMDIVDTYGADALRLYMLSSPVVQAENMSFTESGVDEVAKKNIGRLGNVLAFYKLYEDPIRSSASSNGAGGTLRSSKSEHVLDRWILARVAALIGETTDGYEKYQLDRAVRPLALFIDDLSVWYLRRSRERVKNGDADSKAALATLRYVLHTLSRIIAPSMPFLAEHIFQEVREDEDEESVHLASWPEMPKLDFDASAVLAVMLFARNFVTMALMQRSEAGIKVRQPLARLTIKHSGPEIPFWKEVVPLIADEINVKEVVLDNSAGDASTVSLDIALTSELKEEGFVRDFVREVQEARKNAGLNPHDMARLTILGTPSTLKVIKKYANVIQSATKTKEISFSALVSEGHEVGDYTFKFTLEKI
ncbi:MAG: isoleucine--tRNA ligase, partial [bacterium]|nr:isoleucine--tRNA ligase [bacterium]